MSNAAIDNQVSEGIHEPSATPPWHTKTPGPSRTPYPTTTPVQPWTSTPVPFTATPFPPSPTPTGVGPVTPPPNDTPTPSYTSPPPATPIADVSFLDWQLHPCDTIHRIGESTSNHNRSQALFVEVNPESAVWDVCIESSSNINVTIISRVDKYIHLSVAGTHPSDVKGEDWIRAMIYGLEYSQDFSVVIPQGIGTPHHQPDADVTPIWRFLDSTTSPRSTYPTPSIPVPTPWQVWKVGVAQYCHNLDVIVTDQFDDPIESLFTDSIIEELDGSNWVCINQNLNSNGIYSDPVGWCPADSFFPVPSQAASAFLNRTFVPPIPTQVPEMRVQEINIRVDGKYVLKPQPAITNRIIYALRGDYRIRIVWPD